MNPGVGGVAEHLRGQLSVSVRRGLLAASGRFLARARTACAASTVISMPTATNDQVVALLPALQEAARAYPSAGAVRFVPPRIGILEESATRRHLFVFGRRGVGKSTLLRKLEHERGKFGSEVLYIDVETLRDRPYPDVLIELLIAILGALDRSLALAGKDDGRRTWVKSLPSRWRLRRLRSRLRVLLTEPQQAIHTVREKREGNDERCEQDQQQTQAIDADEIFGSDARNPRVSFHELKSGGTGVEFSPQHQRAKCRERIEHERHRARISGRPSIER